MAASLVCAGCGVTFADEVSACPACGRRRDRTGRLMRRLLLLVLAVAAIAAGLAGGIAWRSAPDPLAEDVSIIPNGHRLSADERGTDLSGTIQNDGRVALNVWVRLRGRDAVDGVVLDRVIGPFRNIGPGGSRKFSYYVDATPFKLFEQDVARVRRSDPASGR